MAATYVHTDGDIALDPVLRIDGATVSLDTWLLGYTRTFELFGKSARIQLIQPWQNGTWSGTVNGVSASIDRQGFADTQVRFAVHLLGAPPLKKKDYAQYRASTKIETLLGVALAVQLPTGEYMDDKLINLGTNRYAFRPEIGFVHDRDRWSFEASGNVSFYTDNDSYFNGNQLELDPLYFGQADVLYRFLPELWAAAGVAYAIGEESTINGVKNDDRKENFLWGMAAGYSIVPWLGLKLQYVRSERQVNVGTDSNRFIVSMSAFW